jgi:leader peptidase (prepilin peptidase)/N-methyltransferase
MIKAEEEQGFQNTHAYFLQTHMIIFFIAILGLFIGSFLGVVVDRFGTERSFVTGRSFCDQCRTTLGVLDLIPVLSFLFSRGKCRHCKTKLSIRYPLIECITAFLFLVTAWRYTQLALLPIGFTSAHLGIFLLRDLLFVSLLIILFLIDARHGVLPDRFTLPGIVLLFGLNVWIGIPWQTLLIGGFVVGGFFALQYVISRGTWVGDGDIRLGAMLGVMLGLTQGFLSLMLAYIIGAAYALVLLSKQKAGMKSTVSFGPFLAIGGWIVLIFGTYLSQRFFPF